MVKHVLEEVVVLVWVVESQKKPRFIPASGTASAATSAKTTGLDNDGMNVKTLESGDSGVNGCVDAASSFSATV